MKLTVLLQGSTTEVQLQRSYKTTPCSTITVKSATVYWDFNNVDANRPDNTFATNDTQVTLPDGYYTFDTLKEILEDYKAEVKLDNTTLQTTLIPKRGDVELEGIGPLLGFRANQVIPEYTKTVGKHAVNVNFGLRDVKVTCESVNTEKNFGTDGRPSKVIVVLPTTTGGSLKGSVTHYDNVNSTIELSYGHLDNVRFEIIHILQELYIN